MNKKMTPFLIAIVIGSLATVYYIFSGKSSLDLTTRALLQEENVKSVDVKSGKELVIECETGEKYRITFQENQSSYEDLVFNACNNP